MANHMNRTPLTQLLCMSFATIYLLHVLSRDYWMMLFLPNGAAQRWPHYLSIFCAAMNSTDN